MDRRVGLKLGKLLGGGRKDCPNAKKNYSTPEHLPNCSLPYQGMGRRCSKSPNLISWYQESSNSTRGTILQDSLCHLEPPKLCRPRELPAYCFLDWAADPEVRTHRLRKATVTQERAGSSTGRDNLQLLALVDPRAFQMCPTLWSRAKQARLGKVSSQARALLGFFLCRLRAGLDLCRNSAHQNSGVWVQPLRSLLATMPGPYLSTVSRWRSSRRPALPASIGAKLG